MLAAGLDEPETQALTDRYAAALTRIQELLETRQARKQ